MVVNAKQIPIYVKNGVRQKLNYLEKIGITQKVSKQTDSVHPVAVVIKNICRICLDRKQVSKIIKKEFY